MVSKQDPTAAGKPESAKAATAKTGLVIIKKYANRRLYNTETSSYVTLDDIAQMVRSDREFQVFDAKSGDDLTHSVLTQIIVEQESRSGGPALLPIPFLRQLIRFYDDSLAKMVPGYLQMSLDTLMREQDRFRSQYGSTWAGHAFGTYHDQTRRNLALFEQAMKMWTPFGPMPPRSGDPYHPTIDVPAGDGPRGDVLSGDARNGGSQAGAAIVPAPAGEPPIQLSPSSATGTPGGHGNEPAAAVRDDLAEMRAQLAAMQAQIERMARDR